MSLLNKQDDQISSDQIARPKEPRNRLTVCNKLCYAIGGVPYQITAVPLGLFQQVFLLEIAELSAVYASIILFVGRAWDAVTDPTVGYLVARSPWTRYGQLLPWIAASTPLAVISYFLMWYVPPFLDNSVKWYWYLAFGCIFQTLQTCLHVPYTSLVMFITPEQAERDVCTAYRMGMEIFASVMATAIQGQIVKHATCVDFNSTSLHNLPVNATHYLDPLSQVSDSLDDTKTRYLIAAAVNCSIYILCIIVLFFGVSERKESCHPSTRSFSQSMRMVVGHGPYGKLMLGLVTTSMAYFFLEGNFALFAIYTLDLRDHYQHLLLSGMVSAVVAIPFWQWFLTKYGKKTAVYFGISFGIPFMILLVVVEKNVILTYCFMLAAGVSLGAVLLLPWSMLPDVVDDFQVANPDSTGHEAIFYSFYVFFIKFGNGLSLAISTMALEMTGYVNRSCTQLDKVHLTLKILISALPISLIAFGLYIFYYYPIDENRRQRNRKVLQELQEKAKAEYEMSSTETTIVYA